METLRATCQDLSRKPAICALLDLAWAMAAGHGVDGSAGQIDPVWMIGGGPGMS
jgi:hypothetical protein